MRFFLSTKNRIEHGKGRRPPPASRHRDEEAGKRGKSPFQFEIMSSDPETPGRARKEAGPAKG